MKLGEGAAAVAAALVLAACTSSGGQTSNLSKIPVDGCTAVVVATSSEKVNLMEDLGRAFKQSPEHEALATCASVVPINVSSGTGAQILAADPTSWPLKDQNYWPTIWSPASTVWTDRVVAAGGEHLVAGAESLARTPVVLAGPQTQATPQG